VSGIERLVCYNNGSPGLTTMSMTVADESTVRQMLAPSTHVTGRRCPFLPLLLAILGIVLFPSCGVIRSGLAPTQVPPPTPLSAAAYLLEGNSLIALVEGSLDRPGHVYVEYWAEGIDRLRSRVEQSTGSRFAVHAVRLRPDTEYAFQVFATDLAGSVGVGPVGTIASGRLPSGLRESRFDVSKGTPTHDLTFLEFRQAGFNGLAAIDAAGVVVWYYEGPDGDEPWVMARKPGGNIIYVAGFEGGTTGKGLVEVSPLGKELGRLVDQCSPFGPIHHEVLVLPDGRVMYLSRDVLRPGYGDPLAPQEGDTIGIWDQTTGFNKIVWNIFDFLSPSERTFPASNHTLPGFPMWGGCERDESVQDWSHADSLHVADDGSVLIGLRNLDQVVSIAPDFKSLRWRLGGPGGEFIFADPSDRFYRPHSASLLPNGNVLLFDNGNFRPPDEGGQYSRALELSLNLDTMTASKVWEYRHEPDVFSACCSNVTRLDNGNTLVLFGNNLVEECCGPFPIVEVDPSGEAVWLVDHTAPDKPNQYRVYPSDSIMGETQIP